ncbi:MAG: hypothetical protein U1E30_03075 [Rhodoblastus sp.]
MAEESGGRQLGDHAERRRAIGQQHRDQLNVLRLRRERRDSHRAADGLAGKPDLRYRRRLACSAVTAATSRAPRSRPSASALTGPAPATARTIAATVFSAGAPSAARARRIGVIDDVGAVVERDQRFGGLDDAGEEGGHVRRLWLLSPAS